MARGVNLPDLRQRITMRRTMAEAHARNAPVYTKLREAPTVAQGILDEVKGNVRLVLMGWPGSLPPENLASNNVKQVLEKAKSHVAVLLNRGLDNVHRILVPVGGGFHSRLAIRLAYEIGYPQRAEITALQLFCDRCDTEELEDRMLHLRETIEDSLGSVPLRMSTRLMYADDVLSGVLEETQRQRYDLIVIGASDVWLSRTSLFGALTDDIAEQTNCSVLLARRHEASAISWLRRQSRTLGGTLRDQTGNGARPS